jgi:sulfite exporter TauE/SafE
LAGIEICGPAPLPALMQVKTPEPPTVSNQDMEIVSRLIALCSEGLHPSAFAASLPLALFLAGLAGGALHCVGMCGPFVLGQVMATADTTPLAGYGEWRRLSGAALAPYHLGRATTYTVLGALAGSATALFTATTGFAWASALLLAVAALLLIGQAAGLAIGRATPWSAALSRLAAPLSRSRHPAGRYGFGVLLGFLPCGLLYAALAAAAGTGSAAQGALAMAGFALGTVPALVAVGWGGLMMRRRLRTAAAWVSAPLLVGNALVMLALASQRL